MKKLDLKMIAEEFGIISSEMHLFYNTETGEFEWYADFMNVEDEDKEKFEEECWIRCPSQLDINEYEMMVNFAGNMTDPLAMELFSVALAGKGAFRRFKDVLHRLDLSDRWFAFKREAYIDLARRWCEKNDIPYE